MTSHAYEGFRNFASCISVQDIELIGDTVWVATSGGIYKHSKTTGKGVLLPNTSSMPDPLYTTIFMENGKTLWFATSQGYLSQGTSVNHGNVYYNYVSAGWSVTDLASYNNFLVVGSTQGISFFDKNKGIAVKNASKFNTLSTSIINTIIIHNDILYMGTDQGLVKLNLSKNLNTLNMYDPGLWNIDSSTGAVRDFIITNDSVKCFKYRTALYKGKQIQAVSNVLTYNGKEVYTFPSEITVIKPVTSECWIGTKENYFYKWNESGVVKYNIDGMTCSFVNRIYVDHASNVWLVPRTSGDKYPYWRSIMRFRDNKWSLYNPDNKAEMGTFGDNPNFMGITESYDPVDNTWRMWFGSSGGGLKCYFYDEKRWSNYHVLKKDGLATFFPSRKEVGFTKMDAVVQDSYGFMWISYWMSSSFTNQHRSLLCYDPRYEPDSTKTNPMEAHYRWFFRNGEENHTGNYTCLTLDANGNIIAGSDDGKVIVFYHHGNPIRDSVTVLHQFTQGRNEFEEFEPLGNVIDMVSTTDGKTRIVTTNGVYRFETYMSSTNNHEYNDTLFIEEELGTSVKAIEAENESILWLAVSNEGLVRYNLDNNERTVFGPAQGLISKNITDLSIDKKNGYLWVATENGVSRLSIGYSVEKNEVSDVLVYPNPFSKKKHSAVHFKNIPFGCRVEIYTVNGKNTGTAKVNRESNSGIYYTWNPNSDIAPGTYFYSVHGSGKSKAGKFIITP